MYMGAEHVMEARIQTLKNELDMMSMKEGDSIDVFSTRVMVIIAKLCGLGDKVEDSYVVKKILRALSSKFLHIASTIEQFCDLNTMTVEELIGRLKAHEERLRGYAGANEGAEHLLLTKAEWKARGAKAGGRKKKFDKSKIHCYNCQKFGHFSNECPDKKKKEKDDEQGLLTYETALL